MTPKDKEAIRRYYKGICQYCGKPDSNWVDHIVPVSKGGADDLLNVTLACRDCNLRKRAINLDPMHLAIATARARDAAPRIMGLHSKNRHLRARVKRLPRQDGVITASFKDLGRTAVTIAKTAHYIQKRGLQLRLAEFEEASSDDVFRACNILHDFLEANKRERAAG